MAQRVLGNKIVAITVRLDICPNSECARAASIADKLGIKHITLDSRLHQTGIKFEDTDEPCQVCDRYINGCSKGRAAKV